MIQKNPLRLQCNSCGAPLGFDIVRQTYACPSCGMKTSSSDALQEILQWRMKHRVRAAAAADAEYYECPGCGSHVLFKAEEAESICDFCGSLMVRHEFAADRVLPEMIIPFTLTLEEAKSRLKNWASSRRLTGTGKAVYENLSKMQGYYLPYRIVKGPVSARVQRDTGERVYRCALFAEGVAVSSSIQFDNLVMNRMEPFDYAEMTEFHPGYIAGQKVRLPNLTEAEIRQRVIEELEDEFLPEIERVMETTGVSVHADAELTANVSVLLPVYFIREGNLLALVNGQTGRVAVSQGKVRKSFPWVIEPLVYTVTATLLCAGLITGFDIGTVLLFGAVFACIFFSIFSEGRNSLIRRIISRGENSRAVREDGEIRFIEGKDVLKNPFDNTPVFIEKDRDGNDVPVKLRFYSFGRILRMILSMTVTIFLPVIPAVLIRLAEIQNTGEAFFERFSVGSGAAWYVLGIFLCIMYWTKGMRIDVYNHPLLYRITETGKTKRMYSPDSRMGGVLSVYGVGQTDSKGRRVGLLRLLWSLGGAGLFLGAAMLIMLIGSTLAIVY